MPPASAVRELSQNRWLWAGLIGLLGLAGLITIWRFDGSLEAWFPKCALYRWTGLHCPGCGTTRALNALLHGRIWAAIRFNPLLILGGPVIAWLLLRQRRREQAGSLAAPGLAWALLCVLALYGLARNIPSPSRSWLAPTALVEPETAEAAARHSTQ